MQILRKEMGRILLTAQVTQQNIHAILGLPATIAIQLLLIITAATPRIITFNRIFPAIYGKERLKLYDAIYNKLSMAVKYYAHFLNHCS